jgi:Beta-lactamase
VLAWFFSRFCRSSPGSSQSRLARLVSPSEIAGYIVQRVSGQPLDQYVEQRIFGPLQMGALHLLSASSNMIATDRYFPVSGSSPLSPAAEGIDCNRRRFFIEQHQGPA